MDTESFIKEHQFRATQAYIPETVMGVEDVRTMLNQLAQFDNVIALTEGMNAFCFGEDESTGYNCRLERWYSYYMDEWFTAIAIMDKNGVEVMHSGMSKAPFSEEEAKRQAKSWPELSQALKEATKRADEQ